MEKQTTTNQIIHMRMIPADVMDALIWIMTHTERAGGREEACKQAASCSPVHKHTSRVICAAIHHHRWFYSPNTATGTSSHPHDDLPSSLVCTLSFSASTHHCTPAQLFTDKTRSSAAALIRAATSSDPKQRHVCITRSFI